jgi:murein L,D-transpeptidase YcbB/YkuD
MFNAPEFLRPRAFLARVGSVLFVAGSLTVCGSRSGAARALDREVQAAIASRCERIERLADSCLADDLIQASPEVLEFYGQGGYSSAWSRAGRLSSQVAALLAAVRAAGAEGLRPADYHLAAIERRLKDFRPGDETSDAGGRASLLADLDILLTDAYLLYASHLAEGKVEANEEAPRWNARCASADLVALLVESLPGKTVRDSLERLIPQHASYALLKKALADYRALAGRGGWPRLAAGVGLQRGAAGPLVAELKARLRLEGYGRNPGSSPPGLFDPELEASVCLFQQRHGLPQTGIVDSATLRALNVPVEDRLRQIAANLERWRWLRHDLGAAYAFVDAAAFEMFIVDRGREVLRMKVVAGTPTWQTPVFSSVFTEVVINPSWYAPPSILLKELIGYMKADPAYLERNKMKLLRGWGPDEVEVDVRTLDLSAVTKENLDFRLVQEPGPLNILGRLKFTHPNRYRVFLHDTPYQSDFGLIQRSASHGCIRIEKPVDFAVFLLGDPEGWTPEKIRELIDTEKELVFPLDGRVAAHVFYGTAWTGEDGAVAFRPDIYFLDEKLAAALTEAPPKKSGDTSLISAEVLLL